MKKKNYKFYLLSLLVYLFLFGFGVNLYAQDTGCPGVIAGGLGLGDVDPPTIDCSSTTNCTTCENGYYLFEGMCEANCPTGYYGSNKECVKCMANCAECSNGTVC